MNVTAYVEGLNIWTESHLGRRAFRSIIEPWAIREAMKPLEVKGVPKPIDAVVSSAPDWWDMLVLSSRVLVEVLAIHPAISAVASLQFVNASLGFVFHDSDTLLIKESIPENCAKALLGNHMEAGSVIVNGSTSFRFSADCRTAVDLWLHVEDEYSVFSADRLARAVSVVSALSGSAIPFTWAA